MSNRLFSDIDEAKMVAARLAKRSAAAESAIQSRDNTLYKLFEKLHQLDKRLRELDQGEVRKALKQKYADKLPTTAKSAHFLLQLTYPSLSSKARSKYASVLRYVRAKKRPGESVRNFVRRNGDIKGCVEKEKKLRDKRPKGWGAK